MNMYKNIEDETLRKAINWLENFTLNVAGVELSTILSALDSAYAENKQLREENEKLKEELEYANRDIIKCAYSDCDEEAQWEGWTRGTMRVRKKMCDKHKYLLGNEED